MAPAEPVKVEREAAPIKPKPVPRPYILRNVFFQFDSATVTPRDQSRILRDCLANGGPRLLTGTASNERSGKYTDTASKAYNLALSMNRAGAVALAYTVSGCTQNEIVYVGETTRYGKNLAMNRRVVVDRK